MLTKKSLSGLVVLLLTAMLVACGDTATNTPAVSNDAAAATPPVALTTTVAAGSNATPAAPMALPTIPGLTEVPISAAFKASIVQQFKMSNADVKVYTSETDAEAVGTSFDSALTAQGYAFSLPGQAKPVAQGGASFGIYSKAGNDIFFAASPVPANVADSPASSPIPGVSPDEIKQIGNQLKGHKSFAITLSGQGLMMALAGAMMSSGGSMPGGAPAATPTR